MSGDRILESGVRALGIALRHDQRTALLKYLDLVVAWSGRLRLTGARTRDAAARVLLAEGLDVVPWLPPTGAFADLGSGAGVPGVLIAVLRPLARIVLVESSRKKAGFLQIVARELALGNVDVTCMRAEAFGRSDDHRARYDVVTARALAEVRVLTEYALPLLRVGGVAVFPKGRAAGVELAEAARSIAVLGGTPQLVSSPIGGAGRHLALIYKCAPTPEEFPRRIGVPEKTPV